jgi:hypothetical protein
MSKNTFKSIGHPFKDFRDTSKNSSDAEFSDEDLKFSFDEKESSDDERTKSRPEAPLNIPHHHVPKIIRREEFTDNIDLSGSGRKRVIGSLDDLTTPLDAMNIDAESATSQIPILSCKPDPATAVRGEDGKKKAKTTADNLKNTFSSLDTTGKTNR